MLKRSAAGAFAALVLAVPAGAAMQTATFVPVADNTLIETPPANSNGAEPYVYAGRTLQFGVRRALLRFDVSTLPANATIQSVSLRVNLALTRGGAIPFGLHRVLASWGEGSALGGGDGGAAGNGDATWIYRFYPTVPWTNVGGDFVGAASATTNLEFASLNPFVWATTPQLVADVQQWRSDPASNHGWVIVSGREGEARTAKQIVSREGSTPPLLTVQYTVPPPPPPPPPSAQVPLLPLWAEFLAALLIAATALGIMRAARRSTP